jgi:ribosomal protein S18 acetylase RimI-like enzyme
MSIAVRPAQPEDVDGLVLLALRAWASVHASMAAVLGERLNALVYPEWAASQADDVRAACADPQTRVFVATDGEAVLGFVAVVIRDGGNAGEIDMIAVDPPAQRQGIARLLTDHAVDGLRTAGCKFAVIATGGDDGHAPARALYDAMGFTPLPLVRYYRLL